MAEFAQAYVGTLKVNLNLDSDGNIAQSTTDAVDKKAINMQGFKATGTLAEANTVFNAVLTGIAGGSYDSLSATKTVVQGVAE